MRKKNWSRVPDGSLTPGQTGRLTVGHKLTSTSTSTDYEFQLQMETTLIHMYQTTQLNILYRINLQRTQLYEKIKPVLTLFSEYI
jgi:hypothetical protein